MDYSLYHYSDLQFREVGSQNVNGADKLPSDGADEKESQVTKILRDMSQGTISVEVAVTQLRNLGVEVQEIANGDVLTFSFTYNNKNYMFTTTCNAAADEGNGNSALGDYLDNYEGITPNLKATASADDTPVDYNQDWAIVKVKASELLALIKQGVIAYPIEGPDGKSYYVSFYNEAGERIDDVTEGGRSELENFVDHDLGVMADQGSSYIYINLPFSLIEGKLHDVIKNDSNAGVYRDDKVEYKLNSLDRKNGIVIPDDSLNDKEFIKTGYTGPKRNRRVTPTIQSPNGTSNSYDGKWYYVRVKASDVLKYGILPEDLRLSFFDGQTGVRIDGDGGYYDDLAQLEALGEQYIYINLPYSALRGEFGEIVKNDDGSVLIEDPDNFGFDKHEIFEYIYNSNNECIGKKLAHFDNHIDNDAKKNINQSSGTTNDELPNGHKSTDGAYVRIKASVLLDLLKFAGISPEGRSFFNASGDRIDTGYDNRTISDKARLEAIGDGYVYFNMSYGEIMELFEMMKDKDSGVKIFEENKFKENVISNGSHAEVDIDKLEPDEFFLN